MSGRHIETPSKTTAHPLYDTNATLAALNCSRWKLWDLCRNDPDFPKPRDIAGKNQWFGSEIEKYKATRPRRIYAAVIAVIAVISIAASFIADSQDVLTADLVVQGVEAIAGFCLRFLA